MYTYKEFFRDIEWKLLSSDMPDKDPGNSYPGTNPRWVENVASTLVVFPDTNLQEFQSNISSSEYTRIACQ